VKKQSISFIPHPDRVLIKISQKDHEEIFYKWIERKDGTRVQLFKEEAEEGMDKKFSQNVSCGRVLAVGANIKNIFPSDIVILDYMVSNDNDNLVGFMNGERMMSLLVKTTYHTEDALPNFNMRKAYVAGDYDELSKVLGVVRKEKLIAFDPYVFVTKQSKVVKLNTFNAPVLKEGEIVDRKVLSAFEGSGYEEGDIIGLKEADLFFRTISGKEITVCYHKEILYKK
jgi:hypothetical protein